MGKFTERISQLPIVGLDTSIFIYHFEKNPTYLSLTRELFSRIESGELRGVTSTISLMEIIVRPLDLGRQDIAQKYEALLVNFPNLEMIDLDRDIIRQAARLRAEFKIRPPDALQVSACLARGAHAFITNDRKLERLQKQTEVIILDYFTQSDFENHTS
jgi:predicted nucleic acid-binding protein